MLSAPMTPLSILHTAPQAATTWLALSALALFGCGSSGSAPAAPAPTASAAAPPEPPPSAEPAASASAEPAPKLTGCDAKIADFDKALSEATNECNKDADCACYASGLSHNRGGECGGVVDAPTGKKLSVIERAAKPNACSNGYPCEPWTCVPICEDHRCQKGPREKAKKK